jgi:hypothetical protein
MNHAQAPAGWYPTPDGRQRYWDGREWTPYFADYTPHATRPAPRKKGLPKWWLLTVGTALVVLLGASLAYWAAGGEDPGKWCRTFAPDQVSTDAYGDRDYPIEVNEGEAFGVQGFSFDKGWDIDVDSAGDVAVKNLTVANHRDSDARARLWITLCKDQTPVAQAECNSGQRKVPSGNTGAMYCMSPDDHPISYDKITVVAW